MSVRPVIPRVLYSTGTTKFPAQIMYTEFVQEGENVDLLSSAQEDTEGGRLLFLAQSAASGSTNMESCVHADCQMGLFRGLSNAFFCRLPSRASSPLHTQNACTLSQPLITPGDIDPVFVPHPLDKAGEEKRKRLPQCVLLAHSPYEEGSRGENVHTYDYTPLYVCAGKAWLLK